MLDSQQYSVYLYLINNVDDVIFKVVYFSPFSVVSEIDSVTLDSIEINFIQLGDICDFSGEHSMHGTVKNLGKYF